MNHFSGLSKKTVTFVLFIIILLVLPLLVFIIQQKQENREHAAGTDIYPANIDYEPQGYGTYNAQALTNPNVGAVDVSMNWNDVEPNAPVNGVHQYNFAPADTEIAAWVNAKKKYNLVIRYITESKGTTGNDCTNHQQLPSWEAARIQHFCDTDRRVIIPDYFDPMFQADLKTYVQAIANHFEQSPYKNSLLYVRIGLGEGGEGFPLMVCTTGVNGCDYQQDKNQLISWGLTPSNYSAFQEQMLAYFKSVFSYTTVIYGINKIDLPIDPSTGLPVEQEVAYYAAANGMGIGQQGLVDTPGYINGDMKTITTYVLSHYPNTLIQLQTVSPVSAITTIQHDIAIANQFGARDIEWYVSDATNSAYQSSFQQWQQIVNSKFSNTITQTPTTSLTPTGSPIPSPSQKPSISPTMSPPPTSCNSMGVTKKQDGTYSFATLSVDAKGNVVDANNLTCLIHLLGFNEGWFTAGVGVGPDSTKFASFKQLFPYNVIRVAINSYWFIEQPNPPDFAYPNTTIRNAIINYVHLAEQNGLYVELDVDSQFHADPCALESPQCTNASQGSQDWDNPSSPFYHDPKGQELSAYQPTALAALTDLATTFKGDPAVLIDVWNEPATNETKMPDPNNPGTRIPISEPLFFQDMQDRVKAVSSVDPNRMIVIYERALSDIMSNPNTYQIFPEKNVIYDSHIYQGSWQHASTQPKVDFVHQHGQGFVIGEWGGAPGLPTPDYMAQFLQKSDSGQANNVNSTYFGADDLVNLVKNGPNKGQVIGRNSIGDSVASNYATIFSVQLPTPPVSGSPTPPSGTGSPTPPPGNGTIVAITVGLHGIGTGGENNNPGSNGTVNPQHPHRKVTVTLADLNGNIIGSAAGMINFDTLSGLFTGTVSFTKVYTGNLQVRIKSDGFLERQVSSIIPFGQPLLQKQQTIVIPPVYLTSGDLNNDNVLNLLDYSILVGCYGKKQNDPTSCPPQYQTTQTQVGADLLDDALQSSDDGIVDGPDYNFFTREISVQQGE